MKRDVMQAAGLESFAEIAIIIFFATFMVIALKLMLSKSEAFGTVPFCFFEAQVNFVGFDELFWVFGGAKDWPLGIDLLAVSTG